MTSPICAIGDTHGHLQLALCMVACWQREQKTSFEAVYILGDLFFRNTSSAEDYLCQLNGKKHFIIGNHGKPTATCLGIGPAYVEEIDPIAGHLKLYK